jgi:uncharacterized protein YacL
MNALIFTRFAFVACATFIGYSLGASGSGSLAPEGAMVGFVLSLLFVLVELGTDILPAKKIVIGTVGLFLGLLLSSLVAKSIPVKFLSADNSVDEMLIICNLIFGYFGLIFALKNADRLDLSALTFVGHASEGNTIILDTNVVIDGRIKGLVLTHFVRGAIVVPSFVLQELQTLADSHDTRKRQQGRRGLETLEVLKTFDTKLTIYEQDYPGISDVDLKLIQLAKDINGEILTTDFNLYKIALLHRVRALNIYELANLLKPTVYIGETLKVFVSKEGKEPGQGIAYLDDGTMVVIDGGEQHMRREVSCVITQILQTSAGRMVFAKPGEGDVMGDNGHEMADERGVSVGSNFQ